MSIRPATTNDSGILAAVQETWSGGEGVVWNSLLQDNLRSEFGIDPARQQAHREWAENFGPWLSKKRTMDSIEVQPPSGWLFRPPGPVPVSTGGYRVTELGPEDLQKIEGTGGLTYQHQKLQPKEYHPRWVNPLSSYGI